MSNAGVGQQGLDARLLRYRGRRDGGDEAIALARDLLDAGRDAEGSEVVEHALRATPGDPELMLLEGRAKLATGDLLGAQAVLLKTARLLPRRMEPFRWLGEVLLKRGDPARAQKVLERAKAIAPRDPDVLKLLERAARLDRVARTAGAGDLPSSPPPRPSAGALEARDSAPPPEDEEPEERTVIRADLTEQLRNMTAEIDANGGGDPPTEERPSSMEYDDDESTDLYSAQDLLPALGSRNKAPAKPELPPPSGRPGRGTLALGAPALPTTRGPAGLGKTNTFGSPARARPAPLSRDEDDELPTSVNAPPLPKRSIKRTATFGSSQSTAQVPPKPPSPPARSPVHPDSRRPVANVARTMNFGGAVVDASDPFAPPEDSEPPPKVSTSPGAASAPSPPALRRRPPSARADAFAPSEDEIDDALGGIAQRSSPPGDPSPFPTRSEEQRLDVDEEDSLDMAAPARPFDPPTREAASAFDPPPAFDPPASRPAAPEPERRSPAPAAPFDPAEDPFVAADAGPPPSAAAEVALGGGSAEDVDEVLAMLRREGLFEPPGEAEPGWAKRAEVKKTQLSGTRIGIWMGAAWFLAIGLAVGGWFGWQELLRRRHAESEALIAQAEQEARSGDHARLVDAERHLREARDLDPHDLAGPRLMLFVHSQRALEDGAFDPGYLRPAIARADLIVADGTQGRSPLDWVGLGDGDANADTTELEAYLLAARAVLGAGEGAPAQALEQIGQALEARPDDPAILYLVGRLQQRLGGEDALTHLEAAAEGETEIIAARIALAEARYDDGQPEAAQEMLEAVLAGDAEHLRARLWLAFMRSDSDEPREALSALDELGEAIDQHGAPTDQVLRHLTRARLLRRQGNAESAGGAVDQALRAGASEPRLLALVAAEAKRAGRLVHAEQAARTAVTGAPSNTDFRKLLAEVQLARRDGRGALTTLAELDDSDPDVIEMRAQAALLIGGAEALTAAAAGLDTYVENNEEPSVEIRALRIRIHVRLGEAREMLAEARQLAEDVPGDPSAALALGEAALRVFEAETATTALAQVVQASPDDAEGHYLLGRAKRMGGDAEGAESALRRAVELVPEHTEARLALGGLLLDTGQYQAADELYTELARSARVSGGQSVTIAGRLGRVESLIGLGRLDDAQVQLEGLRDADRETPSARMTAAGLALARGRAGEALTQIREMATSEGAGATVLARYADALLAAGQAEPAAEAYTAALADDAGSPEALIGQADLAVRSSRAGDALEALGRVERSLENRIRPPSFRARYDLLLGRAHILSGSSGMEAARTALRRAVASPAAPPAAQFFLGEALAGSNSPEARAAYERYLQLAPEGEYAARARRAIR